MSEEIDQISHKNIKYYEPEQNENTFKVENKGKSSNRSFSENEIHSVHLSELAKEEEKVFEINFLNEFDIFSLARHGRYIELESLFLNGIDPDSKDNFGNTILIIAAQNGNKRIAKMALRYGAQINMFNIMGNTALHFCYEYNYIDLAEYLISKGANPNIKNLRQFKACEGVRRKNVEKFAGINSNSNNSSNFKSSRFDFLKSYKNSKMIKENNSKEKQNIKRINII